MYMKEYGILSYEDSSTRQLDGVSELKLNFVGHDKVYHKSLWATVSFNRICINSAELI